MQNLIVRQGLPTDAARCIEFVQTLAAEPNIAIGLSAGEFTLTEEQEAQFIQGMADAENSLYLVAEADERIIGTLTLKGGNRKSNRHAASLGISVAKDYRGQGVGRALMQAATDWAKATPVLKRIELNVVSTNQTAIHLYKSFGFEVEGHRRLALFRDSQFHDDLLMALLLEN